MRESGILMPVSSLPSPYGIGTLGKEAFDFVDFLEGCKQAYWQILPIGPTSYGDSPYQCFSAFAGNPYWIDLDMLIEEGLLHAAEVCGAGLLDMPWTIDYGNLYEKRFDLLKIAASRANKTEKAYGLFCRENEGWLTDYALFMSLKEEHGMVSFHEWPDSLRKRDLHAIESAKVRLKDNIHFWMFIQYMFYKQWFRLKAYANQKGVKIVGDIPIYVSPDSADLWANRELFQADENLRLLQVAGCPPDDYAVTGQRWGNPLYRWEYHEETAFSWWLWRLREAARIFDTVRIDHFRGFAGYYAIPAEHETAQFGHWEEGPGENLISAIKKELPGLSVIAEDLGYLSEDVRGLLSFSGFPGMKVLQFAFDPSGNSDYLPHKYGRDCVVYTGTHDNPTIQEWEYAAAPHEIAFARGYLCVCEYESLPQAIVAAAMASVADLAIIPIQDWLLLGAEAKINTPGTPSGNWRFRIQKDQLTPALAGRIRLLTERYGRG